MSRPIRVYRPALSRLWVAECRICGGPVATAQTMAEATRHGQAHLTTHQPRPQPRGRTR